MTEQERINLLVKECDYTPATAKLWVQSKGKCQYCGEDLLQSPTLYFSGDVDHLLPKNKHCEVENIEENFILSCRFCNSIKGGADVLADGEDALDMIKNNRDIIIQRVQRLIFERLKHNPWWRARQIIRDN